MPRVLRVALQVRDSVRHSLHAVPLRQALQVRLPRVEGALSAVARHGIINGVLGDRGEATTVVLAHAAPDVGQVSIVDEGAGLLDVGLCGLDLPLGLPLPAMVAAHAVGGQVAQVPVVAEDGPQVVLHLEEVALVVPLEVLEPLGVVASESVLLLAIGLVLDLGLGSRVEHRQLLRLLLHLPGGDLRHLVANGRVGRCELVPLVEVVHGLVPGVHVPRGHGKAGQGPGSVSGDGLPAAPVIVSLPVRPVLDLLGPGLPLGADALHVGVRLATVVLVQGVVRGQGDDEIVLSGVVGGCATLRPGARCSPLLGLLGSCEEHVHGHGRRVDLVVLVPINPLGGGTVHGALGLVGAGVVAHLGGDAEKARSHVGAGSIVAPVDGLVEGQHDSPAWRVGVGLVGGVGHS